MARIKPNWTENVKPTGTDFSSQQVIALPYGTVKRGTYDLREKVGAYLSIKVCRNGSADLTYPIKVKIKAIQNNDTYVAGGQSTPTPYILNSDLPATTGMGVTTVSASATAGATTVQLTATTNFAADDWVCITNAGLTTLEWAQVSAISSSPVGIILDRGIKSARTSGDLVYNACNVWPEYWIDGGSLYEVVFDNAANTTSTKTGIVSCVARVYNFDEQV